MTDGLLRLVEKEGSHELIEHNPTEHAEQVIAFTNNPGAYAIPNFDMLDQAWSDDPEKNRAVGIKLIDIALGEKNFGGKNPDAKIFVLLDRPFRPDYRKDAKWANDWSSLRERIELLPQDARPTPEEWATMEQAYAANPGSPEQPLLFHFLSALPPRIRLTPKQLAWTAAIRRGFNDRKLPALQVVQQKLAPDLSANGEDKGWNMLVKFDRVPITDPEELWLIEGDNTRSMELQKQLERDLRAHIESNPHARGRVEIVPVATNRRSYKVHRDLFLSGSYKVPPKVRAQPAARTDASSE